MEKKNSATENERVKEEISAPEQDKDKNEEVEDAGLEWAKKIMDTVGGAPRVILREESKYDLTTVPDEGEDKPQEDDLEDDTYDVSDEDETEDQDADRSSTEAVKLSPPPAPTPYMEVCSTHLPLPPQSRTNPNPFAMVDSARQAPPVQEDDAGQVTERTSTTSAQTPLQEDHPVMQKKKKKRGVFAKIFRKKKIDLAHNQ